MKYIRSCESCNADIRFPIDKGTLFVTCPYCKYTFKIDPDNPSLYLKGRFDVNKRNYYPEEMFYYNENPEPILRSSITTKNVLKKIIVILLFTLLFSHLFKIYNSQPDEKEDYHHQPEIKNKEGGNPEYDI